VKTVQTFKYKFNIDKVVDNTKLLCFGPQEMQCVFCIALFSAAKSDNRNDVTYIEEATINIESVSLQDTDSQDESRADDDAILSRDDTGSRDVLSHDAPLEGVGARPKTTRKLQRKNTPAVLPKVGSLYSSLFSFVTNCRLCCYSAPGCGVL